MNRSRETMQFIQALSAPTRASSSATSSTKNYWLSFRLYQRHLSIVYRSPSTLSSLACAYINPTQQSIRNVSIFFLFSLFNPLNIVAPFFRKDGEKWSSSSTTKTFVEMDWSRTKSQSIEGFFKGRSRPGARGIGYLSYEIFMNGR